jgi:hypothetical protein
MHKKRQKQELKRQEENPEISKKLVSEPRLIFWNFEVFLTSSFQVFMDTNVSFLTPYETKG